MNIKLDEIMHNYVTIVEAQDSAAPMPTEMMWHGDIELDSPYSEIEITAAPLFLENVIIANANDDLSVLKEKKHPVDKEDLIEKAHPKSVYVSNALGDGGLVENQNEQQAKIIEIINKMPSGNHIHLYAEAILGLEKIASEMENDGLYDESIIVDATLADIAAELKKKVITKSSAWFLPVMALLGLGLAGGTTALLSGIFGVQEDISRDSTDLVNDIASWKDKPEYQAHSGLIQRLYQNAISLQSLSRRILSATSYAATSNDPSTAQQVAKYIDEYQKLLSLVESDVNVLASTYPGMSGIAFADTKRYVKVLNDDFTNLSSQFASVKQTRERSSLTEDVRRTLEQRESGHQQAPAKTDQTSVSAESKDQIMEVQRILSDNPTLKLGNDNYQIVQKGFNIDGTLNDGTKEALHNLASAIRKRFGQLRNLPGSRLYNITPAQLRDLIDFAKDPWSRLSQFKLSKEVYPNQ